MQKRALVVAAAVFLVLMLQVWRLHRSEGEAEPDSATFLVPGLAGDDVVGIALGPAGKGTDLRRKGSRWVLDPGDRPAEVALVQLAVRAITRSQSLRRLDGKIPSPEFGLGDGATEVRVTLQDGSTHRLQLGDPAPVGDGRYVAVDGVLHVADATALGVLERDPMDFRDRRLLPVDRAGIDALRIDADDAEAVLLLRDDGGWRLAGEPGWRADGGAVEGLLRDLVGLTATTFLDGPRPEGVLDIEVRRGHQTATITLGAVESGGLRRAWSEGDLLPSGVGGEAARVRAAFLDDLPDADGWRSLVLADFDPAEVGGFEWTAAGETWSFARGSEGWRRADQPGQGLDESGVEAFLRGVGALSTAAFAEDAAADGAVGVAELNLALSSGDAIRLELLRGPNIDLVRVEGEVGLREVDGSAHDLLGRLRPLTAPEPG